MEKVWKDMDEDYMYTKNIAMGVLDRLDFQFEDVKRVSNGIEARIGVQQFPVKLFLIFRLSKN